MLSVPLFCCPGEWAVGDVTVLQTLRMSVCGGVTLLYVHMCVCAFVLIFVGVC